MRKDLGELKTLGATVAAPGDYDPSILEAFGNRHCERDYWVTFTAPEFTTLCPKTGQPDFATLTIRYIPGKKLVESKSLKLYLFGFRNHGDFHEDVINVIYNDLVKLLKKCVCFIEVHVEHGFHAGFDSCHNNSPFRCALLHKIVFLFCYEKFLKNTLLFCGFMIE